MIFLRLQSSYMVFPLIFLHFFSFPAPLIFYVVAAFWRALRDIVFGLCIKEWQKKSSAGG